MQSSRYGAYWYEEFGFKDYKRVSPRNSGQIDSIHFYRYNTIQSNLPDLEEKIRSQLQESENALSKLPLAIPEMKQGKLIYMFEVSKLQNYFTFQIFIPVHQKNKQ